MAVADACIFHENFFWPLSYTNQDQNMLLFFLPQTYDILKASNIHHKLLIKQFHHHKHAERSLEPSYLIK